MEELGVDEHLSRNSESSIRSRRINPDQGELTESRSHTQRSNGDGRATPEISRPRLSRTTSKDTIKNKHIDWDIRNLEYASEVDENLMCPICHSPFVIPISLPCQHIFCKYCLLQAFIHQPDNKSCPSCRRSSNADLIGPVPKVIDRIVDELLVKCPLNSEGCADILPRGLVQAHLDRYCRYGEVCCPSDDCNLFIPRYLSNETCLHELVACPDCSEEVSKLELESHQIESCPVKTTTCPHCLSSVSKEVYEHHEDTCTEKVIACTASAYGCNVTAKRNVADAHIASCPLAKLSPIIEKQNARLQEHALALKHLQRKTALHEAFLDTVKDTLAAIPPADLGISALNSDLVSSSNPPFDSPSSHLLSLYESLREEVARVSGLVSVLDAKTDIAFLNTSLRSKEEAAHRDAIIAQLRHQVQWLLSSRLQGMHLARTSGSVLGANTRRDGEVEDSEPSSSRLPALTRRGSDGLGTGGREKL